MHLSMILLFVVVAAAAAPPLGAGLLPVAEDSLQLPLRAVGQLSNGCTGYLIGPCHVMTVAHCVYEPWRDIWWQGLDFHPGRNLAAKGVGPSPMGSAPKADVRLHPNWTSTLAASASDAAIIITSKPIGRTVGWFRHKPPSYIADMQQGKEAKGLGAAVADQQLTLHIAGYPDNQSNGSMWQQCCSALDWQFQGNLLWHDCYARGGNSGSPVWVVWPKQQQALNSSGTQSAPSWEQFQAVGVHSSSLKFPRDSQIGVYAEELYAKGIANEQGRQAAAAAAAAAGRRGPPSCSAATSSLSAAVPAAAATRAATAAAVPAAAAAPAAATRAAAAAAVPAGRRHRALLAGAGGREADGEHTLLPVAVPFTGDTYKWVEQVLQEFERCPGE